jgi:organic hydroperoxide reductase OsmC/OhrA
LKRLSAGYLRSWLRGLFWHKFATPCGQEKYQARPELQRYGGCFAVRERRRRVRPFEVELKVNLPGINKAEAEALVVQADQTCPYSHAIRGNVPVKITVE